MRAVSALRLAAVLLTGLAAGACDPRDCLLGIGHDDCYPQGAPLAAFPEDDAICRSYGLEPGSRDYAICRDKKLHVRALTERETDYGVLQEPLLPNTRVVTPVPPDRR